MTVEKFHEPELNKWCHTDVRSFHERRILLEFGVNLSL